MTEENKWKFVRAAEFYVASHRPHKMFTVDDVNDRKVYREAIKELKEENAKLIDQLALKDEEFNCVITDFNTFKSKSTEIIKLLLNRTYGEGWNYSLDVKVKAEQFLKESE